MEPIKAGGYLFLFLLVSCDYDLEHHFNNAVSPEELHVEDKANAQFDWVDNFFSFKHVHKEERSEENTREDENSSECHIVYFVKCCFFHALDSEDSAVDEEGIWDLSEQVKD